MSGHRGPPHELFRLTRDALEHVRADFRSALLEGLAADGQEVAALPAWLAPPEGRPEGMAVVVDVGGTNMRAAVVEPAAGGDARGARIVAGPVEGSVPGAGAPAPVSKEVFFGAQAELVARLAPPADLPLGYCFSYPALSLPDGDARLIRWTKNMCVEGVEGRSVGRLLVDALDDRGVRVSGVRVLNDTVTTLMAGAAASLDVTESVRGVVGLIVGTGTNMATFVPPGLLTKLPVGAWDGAMAVNLESGNFRPPHLNQWDEALDMTTDNPGAQRLEKAVSGRYLPALFLAVCGDPGALDTRRGVQALVELAQAGGALGSLAEAILHRSADLVAAGLAGVSDMLGGEGQLRVVAEGSVFWKVPGYAHRVESRLSELIGAPLVIESVRDANLVGAAMAALTGR